MSTPLPRIRANYGEGIGVELFFGFPDLTDDEKAFLTADSAAGDTTLAANGTNFAVGQYILVGQVGNEYSEILQLHASTPPTATLITLAAAAVFAHNRGDLVTFMPFNQIAPEFATSATGSFTTITPVAIRADAPETYMQRTADLSTYYYRTRFLNATTSLYSAYSSTIPASGFPDNALGSIKRRALSQLGEQLGDLITDQFLLDSAIEGRRQADQNPATFRWSFRTKFGANIGQLLTGQWSVPVPADQRDRNTYKNVLGLRMGQQNRPCVYQDRVRFNQNYLNISHSTLASQYTSGDTTLTLVSSADFDSPSGAVSLPSGVVGNGLMTFSYTGNNKATGVLSGVVLTSTIPGNIVAGSDVWQRAVWGLPTAYTIDAGVIYFDVPLIQTWDGQNVHEDYYTIIPTMTQDSDLYDEPFYDLYVYWLKWKIKSLKANGKLDRASDPDFQEWEQGLADLIGQETPGQRINFIPDIEGFLSATE